MEQEHDRTPIEFLDNGKDEQKEEEEEGEEEDEDNNEEKELIISPPRSKSIKSFIQMLARDSRTMSKKLLKNSLSAIKLYATMKKEKRTENVSEEEQDSRIGFQNPEILETGNEQETGSSTLRNLKNHRKEFEVPYFYEEYLVGDKSSDNNDDRDKKKRIKDDYFASKKFQESRLALFGYELEDPIGGGTHGSVYSANRKYINRKCHKVAIKICPMRKELTSFLEACVMEAFVMRKLSKRCPFLTSASRAFFHSVQIGDYSSTYFYLIMPQATASLQEMINESGPLSEEGACQHLAYISMGLRFLHSQGIAHRDLKLANVLITIGNTETKVQLTDFGMSLLASSVENGKDLIAKAGGTLSYMAPELMDSYIKFREGNRDRAAPYDPFPVDVWAVGVCFYAMLYGCAPFGRQPPERDKKIEHAKRMLWAILLNDGQWWRESLAAEPEVETLSRRTKAVLQGLLEPGITKRLTMDEVLDVCIIKKFLAP